MSKYKNGGIEHLERTPENRIPNFPGTNIY